MNRLISIHAPTRGATKPRTKTEKRVNISIHAPTRGATYSNHASTNMSDDFNPRSHERSDGSISSSFLYIRQISIHAPTRGATLWMVLQAQTDIFQSTLPREERLHLLRHCPFRWEFQSTLPREERPCRCEYQTTRCRFQSTLPREERRIKRVTLTVIILFQSTLPREERQAPAPAIVAPLAFQSTLPREERRPMLGANPLVSEFQSTLPREERHKCSCTLCRLLHFNPRSHERSDGVQWTLAEFEKISIHAPTRGATILI